jgi:hypothetical protein
MDVKTKKNHANQIERKLPSMLNEQEAAMIQPRLHNEKEQRREVMAAQSEACLLTQLNNVCEKSALAAGCARQPHSALAAGCARQPHSAQPRNSV